MPAILLWKVGTKKLLVAMEYALTVHSLYASTYVRCLSAMRSGAAREATTPGAIEVTGSQSGPTGAAACRRSIPKLALRSSSDRGAR